MTTPASVMALRARIEKLPGEKRAEYLAALSRAQMLGLPAVRDQALAKLSMRTLRAEALTRGMQTR